MWDILGEVSDDVTLHSNLRTHCFNSTSAHPLQNFQPHIVFFGLNCYQTHPPVPANLESSVSLSSMVIDNNLQTGNGSSLNIKITEEVMQNYSGFDGLHETTKNW